MTNKRLIISSIAFPTALIALINIYPHIDNKIRNIYKGNNLKISTTKQDRIKSKIEENLNIEVENNNYLLLNAILENNSLNESQKQLITERLSKIIDIDPYILKESAYYSLLNLDIYYAPRPFYEKETVLGKYIYKVPIFSYLNDIFIYDKKEKNVLEHELIHSLLTNEKNTEYPHFILEGLTELLTNEFYSDTNYMVQNSYPFEVIAVKMLCEILTPDLVLESYTTGNINIIYDKLFEINPNINSKEFIKTLNNILKYQETKKNILENKTPIIHKQLEEYFLYSTKNKILPEKYFNFNYYLRLFDCITAKYPYSTYLNILNGKEYDIVYYFNKTKSQTLIKTKNKSNNI